jgi:hypothetical protein
VEGFKNEFFKQVAIFTLKSDLNMLERDVRRFEEAFSRNLETIAVKMIEIQAQEKLLHEEKRRHHNWNEIN